MQSGTNKVGSNNALASKLSGFKGIFNKAPAGTDTTAPANANAFSGISADIKSSLLSKYKKPVNQQ
jgi:hypothetical protein